MKILHLLSLILTFSLPVTHAFLRRVASRELQETEPPTANNCPWCNADRTQCIPLEDRPGRFTCICRDGYTEPPGCRDLNECLELDPKPCTFEGGLCVDMDGSYKCICDTNNAFIDGPLSEVGLGVLYCSKAEDNCGGNGACHPLATCSDTGVCVCNAGLSGDGVISCGMTDVPAPTAAPVTAQPTDPKAGTATGGNCLNNGDCNTDNSVCDPAPVNKCRCLDGYIQPAGLGGVCEDENECSSGNNDCDDRTDASGTLRSICTDKLTTQGKWSCTCNSGWMTAPGEEEGKVCIDENECLLGTHNCHPTNEHCVNRIAPAKWECIPATPAPTPAPTPSPTQQLCELNLAVDCKVASTAAPVPSPAVTVDCNTIDSCQDCAPKKICFTYTPAIECATANKPSGLVSCTDSGNLGASVAYAIVDPDDLTTVPNYRTGNVASGGEVCAQNVGDVTADLPSKLQITLGGGAQTVTIHADCTPSLVFGEIFGALTFKSYESSCRGTWPHPLDSIDATISYDAINSDRYNMVIREFTREVNRTSGDLDLADLIAGVTDRILLDPPDRTYTRPEPLTGGVISLDLREVTNITVSAEATAFRRSNCSQTLLYQVPMIRPAP